MLVGQHFLGRSRGQHFRNGGWGWGDEPLEGTVLRSFYLLTVSFQSFDGLPSTSIRFSLSFFLVFLFFAGFSFEMQSHLSCFSSATLCFVHSRCSDLHLLYAICINCGLRGNPILVGGLLYVDDCRRRHTTGWATEGHG